VAVVLGELSVPGFVDLPDGRRLSATLTEDRSIAEQCLADDSPDCEIVDADLAGRDLIVRTRQAGDTFHPLGAPGRKKLKSFLIDAKIPAGLRDRLPLVCSGDEIIWVVGERIAEPVRVRETTKRFLLLKLE
jgi:tRNA(Ile)-lysidine synthase